MSATTKAPRRKATAQAEPNYWEKVTAIVSRPHFDTCEQDGIDDALTILRHVSHEAFQVPSVVVALRLVVEGTINVARDFQYFEPSLVELADLLSDHIRSFGLTPDCHGGWEMHGPSVPGELSAIDTAFLMKLFPDKD